MARKQARHDSGIINPYKVVDDGDALLEEYKSIEYEQPTFAIPELDELLASTEREVAQMIKLYRLKPQAERTVDSSWRGMTPQELLELILN